MGSRIEVLKASLAKKTALFDEKLMAHMDDVRSANGQPLNDKANGAATLGKWERQNDSLRALNASIEKTKSAIEREETRIATVDSVALPEPIKALIRSGVLIQWRKHPQFFFVSGVDKARIHLFDNGQVAHRYLSGIPSQDQYATFRDVFNSLRAQLAVQPTTKESHE